MKIKMLGNWVFNDGDMVWCWCVVGKGVVVKLSLDVCDDLLEKRLVFLFLDYILKFI